VTHYEKELTLSVKIMKVRYGELEKGRMLGGGEVKIG
jgi:hypothetical protein